MKSPLTSLSVPPSASRFHQTVTGLASCFFAFAASGIISSPLIAATTIAATTSTVTTLSISSKTISSDSPVTLLATVTSSGTVVKSGEVAFCDTSSPYCVDGAVLGTAQLGGNGTATITRALSPGTHTIYAMYRGTTTHASSTSLNTKQTVAVQTNVSPAISLTASGSNGSYQLAATVTGHSESALTGTVSFLNAENNQVVNTGTLAPVSINQSFTEQGTYPTGTSPIFAAAGDFNNDGLMDLVIANNNDASVSVLLADPNQPGQFQTQAKYPISGLPYAIAVGDFNADGSLDLAVANSTYLSILLGDSANPGKFQPEATYAIGRGLGSVTIGDFNGDGLPDLAMTDKTFSYIVHIALNDATQPGHFVDGKTISTDSGTISAVANDLNGDGLSDLVLVSSSNDNINVLLADPAHPGNFLSAVNYPTYFEPTGISMADFNGDGVLDIAAIEQSNVIDLFLGDPAHPCQFQASQKIETKNLSYSSVTAADFNGDGLTDLALITNGASNVTVLLADGSNPGSFLPQVNYPAQSGSFVFLTSADFNADGVPDLAALDSGNDLVHIFQGSVTKTASATASVSSSSLAYVSAAYSGNDTYTGAQSCVLSLANLSPVAPVISNIQVSGITSNSATIQWTTNIPTNGMVDYGTTSSLGEYTQWAYLPSTTHSTVLNGLNPGTTYDFQAYSVAFSSGCSHWSVTSPMNNFTTTF